MIIQPTTAIAAKFVAWTVAKGYPVNRTAATLFINSVLEIDDYYRSNPDVAHRVMSYAVTEQAARLAAKNVAVAA
jgi:hypothetical protein